MIKNYFSTLLLILISQNVFSQTEKIIQGKVMHQQFPIGQVEVANFNSKKTTLTTLKGEFSIVAKKGDALVFISKNYDIKKIVLDQNVLDQNNLLVTLVLKPEQLDEVVITKMPSITLSKDKNYEQGKLDKLALEKAARTPKILGINNGTIENGMDFMRIGGMILNFFQKEKEIVKPVKPKIEFIALAKRSFNQQFYTESLKLKPDEIPLFLQFCDADPNSKKLVANSSPLAVMDFLFLKNTEFKKLSPAAP